MKGSFITPDEMLALPAEEISDLSLIPAAPLVSILVVTYNHEAYIAQAIQSILSQQSVFPLELIIGEDKSQDGTLAICRDYQKRYPHLIRIVTWQENVGLNANYLRVWGRARGKYLALLEGDDYWTDPAKLTKQVALMDQFPDTILCGARTIPVGVGEAGESIPLAHMSQQEIKPEYHIEEFLLGAYLHTSTYLFRTAEFKLPACARSSKCLDAVLLAAAALQGGVRCIPDTVSAYRIHAGGLYMGLDDAGKYKFELEMHQALLTFVDDRYLAAVRKREDIVRSWLCHKLAASGQLSRARKLAGETIRRLALHDPKRALVLLFHMCLPGTFQRVFEAWTGKQPGGLPW